MLLFRVFAREVGVGLRGEVIALLERGGGVEDGLVLCREEMVYLLSCRSGSDMSRYALREQGSPAIKVSSEMCTLEGSARTHTHTSTHTHIHPSLSLFFIHA